MEHHLLSICWERRCFVAHTPAFLPFQPLLEPELSQTPALTPTLVSWQWSGGRPQGEVANVAIHGQVSIESDKGNTITKTAEADNPAVQIERPGNDVVKKASELEVEAKAPTSEANGEKKEENVDEVTAPEEKKEEEKPSEVEQPPAQPLEVQPPAPAPQENGEANTGEKRSHEATEEPKAQNGEKEAEPTAAAADEANDEEPAAKKQKIDEPAESAENANADDSKARGRPKKGEANGEHKEKKAPAKKREPKKAATETGEPRRSARIRS